MKRNQQKWIGFTHGEKQRQQFLSDLLIQKLHGRGNEEDEALRLSAKKYVGSKSKNQKHTLCDADTELEWKYDIEITSTELITKPYRRIRFPGKAMEKIKLTKIQKQQNQ